jgi:hypothetical protein
MEHPINAATSFDLLFLTAGSKMIPDELAVSFLNLNLDGTSVQFASSRVPK